MRGVRGSDVSGLRGDIESNFQSGGTGGVLHSVQVVLAFKGEGGATSGL